MDRVSSIAADQFQLGNCNDFEWDFQNIAASEHSLPAAAAAAPPIDSDEYKAFLKSRLDLACAAVAISRASIGKPQDSSASTDSGSKVSDSLHGSGSYSCKRKHKDMQGLDPSLPAKDSKQAVQLKSSSGSSSRELSDDYQLDGSTGGNMDHATDKRMRRMMSNRESARRSRNRKQAHLTEIEKQAAQLRVENSVLSKRLADVTQMLNETVVDNRVLKADVKTLKAKLKIAEEIIRRATEQTQVCQNMHDPSTLGMQSYVDKASDTLTNAFVPIQDKSSYDTYPHHVLTPNVAKDSTDPGSSTSFSDNSSGLTSLEESLISSVNNMGHMRRVASLEHLQKCIRIKNTAAH